VRVHHGAEVQLEVGIAVQHKDVARIFLFAGQAYRATGTQRLGFHRVAQGEAAIIQAKVRADGNVVHDATQAGAETAHKDDRLHQDDLGNICASMIWQIA
jgi:hypothetical protein